MKLTRILVSLLAGVVALAPAARADSDKKITVERAIAAPIAEVWKTWTTSEGITSFLSTPANIELRAGGPFEIYFAPDAAPGSRGSEGCKVLSYLPQKMLSFSWNAPPTIPAIRNGERQTLVVITFEPQGERLTRVRLVHHGWPTAAEAGALAADWDKTFAYFEKAWPNVLAALEKRFAPANGSASAAPADPQDGWVFVLHLTSKTLLAAPTEADQATMTAHVKYLADLTARGVVLIAGPSIIPDKPETSMGVIVVNAPDEAAARAYMEGDPLVKSGAVTAELRPFRIAFLRGRD